MVCLTISMLMWLLHSRNAFRISLFIWLIIHYFILIWNFNINIFNDLKTEKSCTLRDKQTISNKQFLHHTYNISSNNRYFLFIKKLHYCMYKINNISFKMGKNSQIYLHTFGFLELHGSYRIAANNADYCCISQPFGTDTHK